MTWQLRTRLQPKKKERKKKAKRNTQTVQQQTRLMWHGSTKQIQLYSPPGLFKMKEKKKKQQCKDKLNCSCSIQCMICRTKGLWLFVPLRPYRLLFLGRLCRRMHHTVCSIRMGSLCVLVDGCRETHLSLVNNIVVFHCHYICLLVNLHSRC